MPKPQPRTPDTTIPNVPRDIVLLRVQVGGPRPRYLREMKSADLRDAQTRGFCRVRPGGYPRWCPGRTLSSPASWAVPSACCFRSLKALLAIASRVCGIVQTVRDTDRWSLLTAVKTGALAWVFKASQGRPTSRGVRGRFPAGGIRGVSQPCAKLRFGVGGVGRGNRGHAGPWGSAVGRLPLEPEPE